MTSRDFMFLYLVGFLRDDIVYFII